MRAFAQAPSAGSTTHGNDNTFSFGVLAAVLACAAAFLGIGAPAASAATPQTSYVPLPAPPFGPGEGQTDASGAGDLAVSSSTGNIFFPTHQQGNVAIYSPDAAVGGVPLTEIPALSLSPIDPQNIAVDPMGDAVYVADGSPPTLGGSPFTFGIAKFTSDGQATPSYSYDSTFAPDLSGFEEIGGIAVVPGVGDLYVVDGKANKVVKLAAADGHELLSVDGFQRARSVAAGSSGAFYVVDYDARSVESFAADGTPQGSLPLPDGAIPSAITVNAATGDVAVLIRLFGQTYIKGFTAGGSPTFSARVTSSLVPPDPLSAGGNLEFTGMAWDGGGSGRIYVTTFPNGFSGVAATFVPALQPGLDAPTATTGRNTAHVSAEVAPGGEDTTARLEYCPATAACGEYPISNPSDASNPWKRGPEHEHLTATTTIEDDLPLSSNSAWKVRAYASNTVSGTDNTSAVTEVESPLLTPGATTGAAGSVTDTQAQLFGTVDTLGAQATYRFEYGTTTAYGSRIPVGADALAGNHRSPRAVSQLVEGLQPGTTYHYRLVAENSVGEGVGEDRTFTTDGADDAAPARAYEQVTPADKEGAQMSSDLHVQAAEDGSWIAVASGSSTPVSEGNLMRANYLVRRGSADWDPWIPIEAPQNAAAAIAESSTAGVSADGTKALVASNRVLDAGGIEDGGNLYVKDLQTGDYTFVGGAPGFKSYQDMAGLQSNETIYVAGAPDFSWILLWSTPSLLPEATGSALYRWSAGEGLSIESRVPNIFNPSEEVVSPSVQVPGFYKPTLPSASADGSVVAFGTPFGVVRRTNGASEVVSASQRSGEEGFQYPATFDGMSADGRYVFLDSPFPLTDDTPAELRGSNAGYRYDAVTGELTFTVPTSTYSDAVFDISVDGSTVYADGQENGGVLVWRDGVMRTVSDESIITGGAKTYTTENGRYFAFIAGDGEAYLYDAAADQADCASCPLDGSKGTGAHFLYQNRYIGNTMPRAVTEDGTFFFDTAAPLVAQDHNGSRDVYAYKGGRLTLISPGDEAFDATFVAASDGGRDVFFQTDQSLVSRDVDNSTDVYDARVGGGFPDQSPPPPPPSCIGGECAEAGGKPASGPPVTTAAATPARGRIEVRRVRVGSKAARVTFSASQPGRAKVTGPMVRSAMRQVPKAGTYTVAVPLRQRAKALKREGRKLKLTLQLSLSGGWGSASANYSKTLGK